jgi:hypothetical protein
MRNLILVCFILFSVSAYAQNEKEEIYDTAKRIDPRSTNNELLIRNFSFKTLQDSSMVFFHQYDRAKKENIAIQNLGDVSTPYLPLLFQPFTETGFITGINPFGNLYYKKEQAVFYNARLPYTEFYYTQGKAGNRGMIYFDALHTQNFGKQFNISAKYHSTSNDGFYKRQTINAFKNIQVTSYFHSKNNRYLANVILTWNKAKYMENGGLEQSLSNDTLFRSLPRSVRIVPVELDNASNINRFREHQLNQTYWIRVKYLDDSLKTMVPQIGIHHSFTAVKQSNYYTDLGSDFDFYDSVYYHHAGYSADSIGFVQYSNQVQIFSPLKEKGSSFKAGIQYDNFTYYQEADSANYIRFRNHNTSINGQLNFNFLKTFNSELSGQYFLEGYNQFDYLLRWKNEAMIIKSSQISVNSNISASSRQAFFQQQHMFSNHFRWDNNFVSTSQKTISFGIDKGMKKPNGKDAYSYTLPPKFLSLKASYSLIDNMVYYDHDAKPRQIGKGQNSLQLSGLMHLNLRKFQFHQQLAYQVFSKQLGAILLLPSWMSKSSLYLQTYAFKKATFVQIGFDLYYVPDYQARFYNPGTLNFQLSNKHVGAYPFVDFFVNAEIKTARIFLKIEHINQLAETFQGGSDYQYSFPNYLYTSPYQPSAPLRLRLGFAWKFYY